MGEISYRINHLREEIFMKIAVVGVGGVGGYFGGRLAHAFELETASGVEVYFVVRGRHLEAIKSNGLILKTSHLGSLVCRPHLATDRVETLHEVDVFLIGVKGYDLDDVAKSMRSKVTERTVILPLLNGVDARERMRVHLKKGHILPACVYVSAYIEEPGVVVQNGTPGRIILSPDPDTGHRPLECLKAFERASIHYDFKEDAFPAIWEKYVFIASYSLVSARFGKTIGEIYEDPSLRGLVTRVMEEIRQIAEKKKISLPPDIIDLSLRKAQLFTRDTRTSLQRDIEQGKRSELELFGGTLVTLGKNLGVATPATSEIYEELLKTAKVPRCSE